MLIKIEAVSMIWIKPYIGIKGRVKCPKCCSYNTKLIEQCSGVRLYKGFLSKIETDNYICNTCNYDWYT